MSDETFNISINVKKSRTSPKETIEDKTYDAVLAIGYKDVDSESGEYGGVIYGDSEMLARALVDIMERNPKFKEYFFAICEETP